MEKVIFITGFPGFLASEFLSEYATHFKRLQVHALVQKKFFEIAKAKAQVLMSKHSQLQIELVIGDITLNLLDALSGLKHQPLDQVFHFAALYDLSVSKDLAYKVNVDGTANILKWLKTLPKYPHFHYISTCYVSGRHDGFFTESDLQLNQSFNNFYEETKFHAEILVQEHGKTHGQTNIYRPAIVVGNSWDGATQKYDGPYYIIRWLLKQPGFFCTLPVMGAIDDVELNVVPRDYVIRAISSFSQNETSNLQVYQLSDPSPLTIREVLKNFETNLGKKILTVPLPLKLAKFSLDRVPGVYPLMEIPSSAVDYFVHPTKYRSRDTVESLKLHQIQCPHFTSYSAKLFEFVKENPQIKSEAMA